METIVEKKPIAPILRKMEIGQKECWPRQRVSSLRNIIGRLQLETDMKFKTYREDRDSDEIVVIRTK